MYMQLAIRREKIGRTQLALLVKFAQIMLGLTTPKSSIVPPLFRRKRRSIPETRVVHFCQTTDV
jgi:hypothetical protein